MSNQPVNERIETEIQYWENHANLWVLNATELGISSAQATSVKTAATAARNAYNAAQTARQASKIATTNQTLALNSLRSTGTALQNLIKSFIEQSGSTKLWGQAGLTPPAPRGTTPPPNAPTNLAAAVDSEGRVKLTWKASQPEGVTNVVYRITRSINNAPATALASVGGKKYTDETVTIGAQTVAYVITPQHGTRVGEPSETLLLRFGRVTGPTGQEVFSITSSETVPTNTTARLAA